MRLKLPTRVEIEGGCERTGGDGYVYMAVYTRDGTQLAATHGPATSRYVQKLTRVMMEGYRTNRGLSKAFPSKRKTKR